MPKRIISDVIWKSKRVRSIQPPEFRGEYAWIMPAVEDNGVFEYDPESLWADAYALARPGWTPERVKELLDELIRVGLLIQYEAQGKTWCYLVGSDKPGHLPPPSMRNSKFPLPPSYDKPSQSLGSSNDEPSLPLAAPRETLLGTGTVLVLVLVLVLVQVLLRAEEPEPVLEPGRQKTAVQFRWKHRLPLRRQKTKATPTTKTKAKTTVRLLPH